jgi:arylsulfatase
MRATTLRKRDFRPALCWAACTTVAACGGGGPIGEDEVKEVVSQLLAPAAPIPLPAMTLPSSPGVVRLEAHLAGASVTTSHEALPKRDLASIGPFDTHAPDAEVRLGAANYKWLKLTGFEVAAADVGEIQLSARFENAGHFVLTWGESGRLRVDVQDPGEFSDYVLSTDGLVDWTGTHDVLRVGVLREEAGAETRVEVRSASFRDRRAAFAESVGSTRRRIAREVRPATFVHGGTRLVAPVPVPARARLSFGAAVLDEALELRVSLGTEVVFEQTIERADHWRDVNLPLPKGVGTEAELTVDVVGGTAGVLFLANPVLYRPEEAPARVVVYLVDTLGARHMSLYGYERETSPRIDELASEGVWFANAFANSSWTPESVPVLMTGLAARSNGVFKKFSKLAPDFVTLQEVFAEAGFATAAWSTNGNAGPARGTDEGFDSFFDHIARSHDDGSLRTVPVPEVLRWMENQRDRPTFVYVHTAEPHHPYEPPDPFARAFDSDYRGSVDGGMAYAPARLSGLRAKGELSERDLEHLIARYDGEIAFADDMFGQLIDHMGDRGLLEDALVVLTADHGEAFGQHGYFGHGGALYPELLRVPLVFHGPAHVAEGLVVEDNVQLLDVLPTLIELLELGADVPTQGDSLAPLLRGEAGGPNPERPILSGLFVADPPVLSLIQGTWKLDFDATRSETPRFALFDLTEDPDEHTDLFATEHARAREMLADLLQVYAGVPRYDAGVSSTYEIGVEQIERLKALGYIDDH